MSFDEYRQKHEAPLERIQQEEKAREERDKSVANDPGLREEVHRVREIVKERVQHMQLHLKTLARQYEDREVSDVIYEHKSHYGVPYATFSFEGINFDCLNGQGQRKWVVMFRHKDFRTEDGDWYYKTTRKIPYGWGEIGSSDVEKILVEYAAPPKKTHLWIVGICVAVVLYMVLKALFQ